jgi:hypothetical protein
MLSIADFYGNLYALALGIDYGAWFDGLFYDWSNGFLLHVFQHDNPHLASTFNHAEDRKPL